MPVQDSSRAGWHWTNPVPSATPWHGGNLRQRVELRRVGLERLVRGHHVEAILVRGEQPDVLERAPQRGEHQAQLRPEGMLDDHAARGEVLLHDVVEMRGWLSRCALIEWWLCWHSAGDGHGV
jgi:hypothetical protein